MIYDQILSKSYPRHIYLTISQCTSPAIGDWRVQYSPKIKQAQSATQYQPCSTSMRNDPYIQMM